MRFGIKWSSLFESLSRQECFVDLNSMDFVPVGVVDESVLAWDEVWIVIAAF